MSSATMATEAMTRLMGNPSFRPLRRAGGDRYLPPEQGPQVGPEPVGNHLVAGRRRVDAVRLVQARVGGDAVEQERHERDLARRATAGNTSANSRENSAP